MNEQRLDELIYGKDVYRGVGGSYKIGLKRDEIDAFEAAKERGYLLATSAQKSLRFAWELWCEIHLIPYAVVCSHGSKSKVSLELSYLQRMGNAGNLTEEGLALLLDLLHQHRANWNCSEGHAEIYPVPHAAAELLMRQMLAIHAQHHHPAWDGRFDWQQPEDG